MSKSPPPTATWRLAKNQLCITVEDGAGTIHGTEMVFNWSADPVDLPMDLQDLSPYRSVQEIGQAINGAFDLDPEANLIRSPRSRRARCGPAVGLAPWQSGGNLSSPFHRDRRSQVARTGRFLRRPDGRCAGSRHQGRLVQCRYGRPQSNGRRSLLLGLGGATIPAIRGNGLSLPIRQHHSRLNETRPTGYATSPVAMAASGACATGSGRKERRNLTAGCAWRKMDGFRPNYRATLMAVSGYFSTWVIRSSGPTSWSGHTTLNPVTCPAPIRLLRGRRSCDVNGRALSRRPKCRPGSTKESSKSLAAANAQRREQDHCRPVTPHRRSASLIATGLASPPPCG